MNHPTHFIDRKEFRKRLLILIDRGEFTNAVHLWLTMMGSNDRQAAVSYCDGLKQQLALFREQKV